MPDSTNPPGGVRSFQLHNRERERSSLSVVPYHEGGGNAINQDSVMIDISVEIVGDSLHEDIESVGNIDHISDLDNDSSHHGLISVTIEGFLGNDERSALHTLPATDTLSLNTQSAPDSHSLHRYPFLSASGDPLARMHEEFITHVLSLTRAEVTGSALTVFNPFIPPDLILNRCPVRRIWSANEASSLGVCPICLEPYRQRMMVRTLPNCRHIVHKPCIDKWIRKSHKYRCPLDNLSIIPDSGQACIVGIELPLRTETSPDTTGHGSDHHPTILSNIAQLDDPPRSMPNLGDEPRSGA